METNFLYVLAAILVAVWLVGIVLSVGALINILLVVAAVLILLRLVAGRRGRRRGLSKKDIYPPRPV